MKLLNVICSVDPRGGGPIDAVMSCVAVWRSNGHEGHVACLDSPSAPWVVNSPVSAIALGYDGGGGSERRRLLWQRYQYAPNLVGWLRRHAEDYDAVIVNGLWNYASFGAWRALRRSNTPYFLFAHGMLDPWFNRAYPTKTFFKNIYWKLIEHRIVRDACGVIFTCENERESSSRSFQPYRDRGFIANLGTREIAGDAAAQADAFEKAAPGLRGRPFILFIGRLHPIKGLDILIEAFARSAARHCEVDLVIAGPDQVGLKGKLQALATERGVSDRVHWPGMLSGDAKWGAYRAALFSALPSHHENFGIVVAESLSLATPVLISDKVNIWHEIAADGAGHVVKDDVESVSRGLEHMLSLSPDQRRCLSDLARTSFLRRFNQDTNALEMLAMIEEATRCRAHDDAA